ncbi:MAG: gamma-glutamyltransferase [Armatimonadota bacterium]
MPAARLRLLPLIAALALAAGALVQLPPARPRPSWGQVGYPVAARHGMVASASAHASRVGAEVLRKGGNAVDAAVAVGLALAVTYPAAGNLGGGGFMVLRMADGTASVVDFRETAPAAASREMYLDPKGDVIPEASTVGYRAVGVPGTVAGLALALERYGTRRWSDMVEPARKLAAEGFPVSYELAGDLRRTRLLSRFPETRRIFQRDGDYYEPGERLRQPDLAATLRRLQKEGPEELYTGRTARLLADEMRAHGGLITPEDLKAYRPVIREPLRGRYRGYEILTMPPPSSGGVALLQMLNVLERFELRSLGHSSSERYHLLIETMRRAFADRSEYLGDPDFVRVPVRGLTSPGYAERLFQQIDRRRATPSAQVKPGNPAPYESPQTTHYSVVDRAGNAVSVTYTLNAAYGSGVTVKGAGFLLNNEMDDFTSKPGSPNLFGLIQGERNAIAPRKRPLSSMTPTILLKDGKLFMVVGSPGGPTIINTVLQVTLNVIDHDMNLQQAIAAPRIHHQWLPDVVRHEPYGLSRDVQEALRARGHELAERPAYMGDAEGVLVDPETGLRFGASDPRNPDSASVGY